MISDEQFTAAIIIIFSAVFISIGLLVSPASAGVFVYGSVPNYSAVVLPNNSYVHQGENISQGNCYDLSGIYGWSGEIAHWADDSDSGYAAPETIIKLVHPEKTCINPEKFPVGRYRITNTLYHIGAGLLSLSIKGSGLNSTMLVWDGKKGGTAIGKNAKVSTSNTIVLGGTGSDAVSVAVGNHTAAASSLLDLTSTTKGALIPRLTQSQMLAISSPATGLFVYNTDSLKLFSYDGVAWRGYSFGGGSGIDSIRRKTASDTIYQYTAGTPSFAFRTDYAINILDYGAKGDMKFGSDGAITSGTPTFTSATIGFVLADVGKTIRLTGAGAAGVDLITTISAYINSTTVTLSNNASTTISTPPNLIMFHSQYHLFVGIMAHLLVCQF